MAMTIEFKAPIPRYDDSDGVLYAQNKVGVYHLGRFMQDPSGR